MSIAVSERVRVTHCTGCSREVLEVEVDAEILLVERAEVVPSYPCPRCLAVAARGDKPGACDRCGGTRRLGVRRLPDEAITIDEDGRPRRASRSPSGKGLRRRGEAVHLPHACTCAA